MIASLTDLQVLATVGQLPSGKPDELRGGTLSSKEEWFCFNALQMSCFFWCAPEHVLRHVYKVLAFCMFACSLSCPDSTAYLMYKKIAILDALLLKWSFQGPI